MLNIPHVLDRIFDRIYRIYDGIYSRIITDEARNPAAGPVYPAHPAADPV
jgi:hypothetical protein